METNVLKIFQEYVGLFNDANRRNDTQNALQIAKKITVLGSEQLKISSLNPSIKEYYITTLEKINVFVSSLKINKNNTNDNKKKATEKSWFNTEIPNISLNDVIGLETVKDEFLVNILAPLSPKYSEVYKKYRGSELSSKILLYGPPGTGKTFIVKALAGSLNVKVAYVQSKDILSDLVGVAEKQVDSLFEEAKTHDKCIIFFDEIDALAANRDIDESRNTRGILTALLTKLDGFDEANKQGQQHIIIAASNRPWALDSAFKRGGRFENQIYVPIPDYDTRYALIKKALKVGNHSISLSDDINIEYLANKLDGYSTADINSIIKQIANQPLKREIEGIRRNEKVEFECITKDDCNVVINKHINSITDQMLLEFDAYSASMQPREYLIFIKNKIENNKAYLKDVKPYIKRLLNC